MQHIEQSVIPHVQSIIINTWRYIDKPRQLKKANEEHLDPSDILDKYGIEGFLQLEPRISLQFVRNLIPEECTPDLTSGKFLNKISQMIRRHDRPVPSLRNAIDWLPSIASILEKNSAWNHISYKDVIAFYARFNDRDATQALLDSLGKKIIQQGRLIGIEYINTDTYSLKKEIINPVDVGSLWALNDIADHNPDLENRIARAIAWKNLVRYDPVVATATNLPHIT